MHLSPPPCLHTVQAGHTIKGMKDLVDSLKRDPKREYSLAEIASKRLMPWARNGRTIREILENDRIGQNLLNAKVTGLGNRRRYTVRAEDLITYLATVGPYLLGTVRKTKPNHEKRRNKDSGNSERRTAARKASKHLRSAERLPGRAQADGKKRAR